MSDSEFLNVPGEIQSKIKKKEQQDFDCAFRALYQKGNPRKSDFLPTFADENQNNLRLKRAQCGSMASFIVSKHKEFTFGDYALSLFTSIDELKSKLWRNNSCKKDHPAIAKGYTDRDKGYAIQDKGTHVLYFLYNYENRNPYSDFSTVEEANFDE